MEAGRVAAASRRPITDPMIDADDFQMIAVVHLLQEMRRGRRIELMAHAVRIGKDGIAALFRRSGNGGYYRRCGREVLLNAEMRSLNVLLACCGDGGADEAYA